jgi:DNA-binding transcriptional regulator PaaX
MNPARQKIIERVILACIPFTEENMIFSRTPQKFYIQLAQEYGVHQNAVSSAIYRAKKKGYLVKLEEGLAITDKGKSRVSKRLIVQDPASWDGRWRIILFDIPEKKRATRNLFRRQLGELGFKQHQLSVWITPYDVTAELEELINDLHLEEFVKYIIGESVLGEAELKRIFNLRSPIDYHAHCEKGQISRTH